MKESLSSCLTRIVFIHCMFLIWTSGNSNSTCTGIKVNVNMATVRWANIMLKWPYHTFREMRISEERKGHLQENQSKPTGYGDVQTILMC